VSSRWLEAQWPAPHGIRALTTLRTGPGISPLPLGPCNLGDRCGDSATNVAENRLRLLQALKLPSAPCWLRQVHGNRAVRVDAPAGPGWATPEADAAVSTDPNAVLAVLTADCLPVALASIDGSVVGVAHAGWRGLASGVLENTVAACAIEPSRLVAWLGPAIGPSSFEVGPEVRQAFVEADPQAASAFAPGQGDRWMADLYHLAHQRLLRTGISSIFGGGEDTYEGRHRFHSYRRDGSSSGRMATLIWRDRAASRNA